MPSVQIMLFQMGTMQKYSGKPDIIGDIPGNSPNGNQLTPCCSHEYQTNYLTQNESF